MYYIVFSSPVGPRERITGDIEVLELGPYDTRDEARGDAEVIWYEYSTASDIFDYTGNSVFLPDYYRADLYVPVTGFEVYDYHRYQES